MSAKTVVEKFGGQTALAKLVGINQSAVAYWVKKGSVPSKWHARLLEIANGLGIDLSASDFVDNQSVEKSNNQEIDTFEAENLIPVVNDSGAGHLEQTNSSSLADFPNTVSQFMFYAANDGSVKVQVMIGDETVWSSQKGMGEIFDVDVRTISEHLGNIFSSGELDEYSVIRKFRTTAVDGKNYDTNFYNLDVIISVGYRVNSSKATQFRRWATSILKEYMIKGYALDDERLKQGNQLFGQDYFDELLERIRKIRTSERMFWQKVTDLYSQCSSDYDKTSPITQQFFANVQNKFHYAIHHHTAAELIKLRADATKPNMGLVHYANMNKDGVILKKDLVGKNFLTPDELEELERLVENYLGSAELFAKRKIIMTMKDWVQKLDEFFRFNAYDVLDGFGKVRGDDAKKHALSEYGKYISIHDKEFRSDFDRFVDEVKVKNRLPKKS
jgi:hypothetical protein